MSTQAAIARRHGDGFLGVYHHWDGYPNALGKTLWDLATGAIFKDLPTMLWALIDAHPAGWSSINGADFKLTPGYDELGSGEPGARPQCYCHGDRHEAAQPVDQDEDGGMEWAYVFDEKTGTMSILKRVRSDSGRHAVGMFGTLGVHAGSGERNDQWTVRWAGPLSGEEPDWGTL